MRTFHRTIQTTSLAAALLAFGLAGCDEDTRYDSTPGATLPDPVAAPDAPPAPDDVKSEAERKLTVASSGSLGPYLADSEGHPVYFLEGDSDGSACTAECLEAWPPVLSGAVVPESGGQVQADLIGTIERADDSIQVSYNGHPLYYYAEDATAEVPTGHDVHDQWGEWYLLTPAGEELQAGEAAAEGT